MENGTNTSKNWLIRSGGCLLATFLLLLTASCSKEISPPFEPSDGIQSKKVLELKEEPSGMQGSGYGFAVWTLSTNTTAIAEATSSNLVRKNLYWHQAPTIQFNQTLDIVAREPAYAQVKPKIMDVLAARDLRFAWEEFSSSEKPPYAAIWICSPSLGKIAYLHVY